MVKGTILIADEVKLLQEVLKEFLRLSPVRVITAGSGAEALSLAQREHPDLIVLDLNMPVMDGLNYCALIKGDHHLKTTPVIMLGNSADQGVVEMCRRAGCDGYLAKPVLGHSFLNLLYSFFPMVERRKLRIPCSMPVTVKTDDEFISGVSSDIGMGGVYVSSDFAIMPNKEVIVSFRVPVNTYALTVVRGRVTWTKSAPDCDGRTVPQGFGVEFLEILGEGLNRLRFGELSGFINGQGGVLKASPVTSAG
jgi:CheY-like chemotaxis protein